jgi:CheY-like chemotaxis protein
MLGEILSFAGYEPDISTSGLDALDKLAQRDYDLILSDLRMPDLDGPSLYKALQIKKPHLTERVVFVTGDTLSASVSTFLGQCGRPCIEKPFSPEEVRRVVGRVLAAAAARERPVPYAK